MTKIALATGDEEKRARRHPFERAARPVEIAPLFVFLASNESR